MRRPWLVALLPALICGLLVVIITVGSPNPRLVVSAKLDLWIMLATVAIYLVIGAVWGVQHWHERLRKHVVAQLQQQSAEDRQRFLQRLDHELKNPLMAIRAGLANLTDPPLVQDWQATVGSVATQTMRLGRLSADLRKLADLETRPLEATAVDMNELLREVVSVVQERPAAMERRLNLLLPQAPWPLPALHGDHDLLFLAIHNLLDNAVKFTQPDDTIELRAFEAEASVVIEVADTGPGVPEAEQLFVWQELYRGQTTRAIQGTGLGLALVRAVVQRHGGQTSLRSRVGQGTVFIVRLPINPFP